MIEQRGASLNNPFYKSTPLFKELKVLDLIEKNQNITHLSLSDVLNSSVAMTNNYLTEFEKAGLLERKYNSTKDVEYLITKKGRERRKYLQIIYLDESQKMYDRAKRELVKFIQDIKEKGFNKILLYGAGEVAEIFLNTIQNQIEVLAIIDDDTNKQGKTLANVNIVSRDEITNFDYDAILISSYGHYQSILDKLQTINNDKNKILRFF